MAYLPLALRLLLLPGRLVIKGIDGASVRPLGPFLRGAMHTFVWLFMLMVFATTTYSSPPAVAAPTVTTPRYAPAPRPTPPDGWLTTPPSAAPAIEGAPADGPKYIPLPNNHVDNHDHKSRYCRKHWWC
jgi:hypothetical protein